MTIETFRDRDAAFVRWRESHARGFIVNHARVPTPRYLMLHSATCFTLNGSPTRGSTWTSTYAKTCGDTVAELAAWALRETSGRLQSCGRCQPAAR